MKQIQGQTEETLAKAFTMSWLKEMIFIQETVRLSPWPQPGPWEDGTKTSNIRL